MKPAPDFEQLVDAHYAALYRFALSLSRTETDAYDLVQQTYFLWAKKGGQMRDPALAKGWLFTTLYREFLGARKQAQKMEFTNEETGTDAGEEKCPEENDALSDPSTILDAISGLRPAFRAPITLFYLQEFSYKEIAAVLEIPIGTVMSRLARGKSELRKKLRLHWETLRGRISPLLPAGGGGNDE